MKTLGIIGGLGPMATACLLQLIIEMTDAKTDQAHLDVIVFNRPDVPDRTAYLLDRNKPSPAVSMIQTAKTLEALGAFCLAAPCVTSHALFPEIQAAVHIPLISMVEETAAYLLQTSKKKAGIMATTGTLATRLFQTALEKRGIEAVTPTPEMQTRVMGLIYDNVKAGIPADMDSFHSVSAHFFAQNCDSIILGCTELSVIKRDAEIGSGFLDALEVLAASCVQKCGKPLKEKYQSLI